MLWGSHLGGLELRSEGGETRLLGRFPYGRETVLREARSGAPELREVFAPRAFRMRVEHRNRNIMALAGHDFAKPLASLATHTLDMEDTEDALLVEIRIKPEIAAASYCRDILAGVRAGLTVGLSPGFRVASDLPGAEVIQRQGNVIRREVRTAFLEEISIVTRPAYPEAQIEARCWRPGEATPRSTAPHPLQRWRL
ncbi:HK97 family phage prohead protease [Cereibacter azotoformans]|uniref:HK97 family phage prohead protease n=1 Tax=Cereibacter TaxID=1653176 RepID=UPI000E5A95DF|nr:HK97 family phage prohead protease [Cereibacter sphaeroides]RIA00035.1 HK97 family phage prohead protease [Cereibacter sphaeroides]